MGSEMCIRDSCLVVPEEVTKDAQVMIDGHGFKSHIIGEVVCV